MKICPSCRKTYEDESLVFCLDDGTRLIRDGAAFDSNATWNLPPPGPTVASPRPANPTAQSTITSRPEQFQKHNGSRIDSRSSALPWVFAIVLVLAASGVLIAWFMTRGRPDETTSRVVGPTPAPSAMASASPVATAETSRSTTTNDRPAATPNRLAKETDKPPAPTPLIAPPKPRFSILDNRTLNGSRITYYPRTSFALCQADCAGNANCKGLTWIRPGAYNPSDPGMCYLMATATPGTSHVCCISSLKN